MRDRLRSGLRTVCDFAGQVSQAAQSGFSYHMAVARDDLVQPQDPATLYRKFRIAIDREAPSPQTGRLEG